MDKQYKKLIAAAMLLLGAGWGLNSNVSSVFIEPIASDLGVLHGDVSLHMTLIIFTNAILGPLAPKILQRVKYKHLIIVGVALMAGAAFLSSQITAVWQLNLLGIVRGAALGLIGTVPMAILVNNWFVSKHGFVSSLIFASSGIGGALFSPVIAQIIGHLGWRWAYIFVAIGLILCAIPCISIDFALTPEEVGHQPYQRLSEDSQLSNSNHISNGLTSFSYRSPVYWLILLAGLFATALVGLTSHMPTIAGFAGFSLTVGSLLLSMVMIGNIVFKLGIGTISDRTSPTTAFLIIGCICQLGLVLLASGQSPFIMLAGGLLFGSIYAMIAVGTQLLIKEIFGTEAFAKAFAAISVIQGVGGALTVTLYGYSFDFLQAAHPAIYTSMVLLALAMVAIFAAKKVAQSK